MVALISPARVPPSNIWAIAFLASFTAPLTGLFVNSVAKNKIEGFAAIKGTQIVLLIPLVALYFMDKKRIVFFHSSRFLASKGYKYCNKRRRMDVSKL